MNPIASRSRVGGQKCEGGTGHKAARCRRTAAIAAVAASTLLFAAISGCARQDGPASGSQPGAADIPSPGAAQPQPGQPGAETTPLANSTPVERQTPGGATGTTGADWLAALGALF